MEGREENQIEVGEEKHIGENGPRKKLLKEGEGDDSPNTDDEVEVHYVALLDGTQFEYSSLHCDTPFIFKLGQGKVALRIVSETTLKLVCRSGLSTEDGMIMVKATFKDDTIKFQLLLSLGVEKMMQEVEKRLKLKIGSFKLKYLDEDEDWILLACDRYLDLCVKNLRLLGKSTLQVLVLRLK